MSLPHFFLDNQVLAQEKDPSFELRLNADDMKHVRALRLKPTEHIAVIDAASDYFECEVDTVSNTALFVHIAQRLEATERPSVILAQGLAKGDKMDTIIRHATELGVAAFVPLLCERSIVKLDRKRTANRMQRWNTLAKSAAMQSGQTVIPEIAEPTTFENLLKLSQGATAILVCWEEAHLTKTLSRALEEALAKASMTALDARIVVIVVPEGGLTSDEVNLVLSSHPRSYAVSLGPSILRTETAGIVAPALVLYELERNA